MLTENIARWYIYDIKTAMKGGENGLMTVAEMQQYKKETGLSYEEISERSGVPLGTVQKVISGTTKSPRYRTLSALEKCFLNIARERSENTDISPGGSIYEKRKRDISGRAGSIGILADASSVYQADSDNDGEYGLRKRAQRDPRGGFTLKDYLEQPAERRVELIDGIFYDMAAPTTVHQMICSELYLAFAEYIRSNKGKCEVFFAPIDVQLDEDDRTVVQPDLCAICDSARIRKDRIYGAPDLIVEITSPATRRNDMTLKMWKYSHAGVREYWIVDPENLKIIVYDYEHDLQMTVYSFHDKIPVNIYEGKLQIDFEKIWERIQRFWK